LVGPLAAGLLGDAYVESGDVEKGAKQYLKAARMNKNKATSPVFYKKAGIAFEELKKYAWERFENEYNYTRNKQLYPNKQQRFKEYCLGMPFDFTTWYNEQRQILNSWELYKESATDEQTETLYFYLIYRELK
jgi:hypothetical protein